MPFDTGAQGPSVIDLAKVAARGAALELGGRYEMPPGDPLAHFGAGLAKVLASNVFITGLDLDFAMEHVGYFTAPRELRGRVRGVDLERARRAVHVTLDNGVTRTARICAGQGAIALPLGADDVLFTPSTVESRLGPPGDRAWPAGDVVDGGPAAGVDAQRIAQALDEAFAPSGMTAAVVVTHRGRIVGERYAAGIGIHTPLESWSMGKSVTATLLGMLVRDGAYDVWEPAPIPEWQGGGDPRAAIRIVDILRMSSGLRFRAMADPDYAPAAGYPDHLYVYTGGIDAFAFAAARPQQWPPNTVGRYRNGDPVLANYLVRLALEARGERYHQYPQQALFDRLGMRDMVLETDPYGNFLLQGYELGSARDWARLGNLYLRDGVWNGERILPEGWVELVSTLAPAWAADGRPIYGGFFWLNGDGAMPIPPDAYFMAGAGGQRTVIIPSHDLVVARLGHYSGMDAGLAALDRALATLLGAVPSR